MKTKIKQSVVILIGRALQEMALMQGFGQSDWLEYKMDETPLTLMQSFLGNAFLVNMAHMALNLFEEMEAQRI